MPSIGGQDAHMESWAPRFAVNVTIGASVVASST